MRIYKGSSLSQYAIVLGILVLVLAPAFLMFGQTIYSNFEHFYNTLSGNSSSVSSTSNNNSSAAQNNNNDNTANNTVNDPEASPSNPVKNCSQGSCTIDFGEFALTGIPEDFSEIVETSGVSTGTDELTKILIQLADQLESQGNPASRDIRELATTGHNIAVIEKEVEKIAAGCSYDETCLKSALESGFPVPAGYDSTFNSLSESTIDMANITSLISYGAYEARGGNADYPAKLMYDKLNTLMDSGTLTDANKGVIQELYLDIAKLADDVEDVLWYANKGCYNQDYGNYVTGETIPNSDLPDNASDSVQTVFQDYKPASMTHLDSALICASGNGTDTGEKCH